MTVAQKIVLPPTFVQKILTLHKKESEDELLPQLVHFPIRITRVLLNRFESCRFFLS